MTDTEAPPEEEVLPDPEPDPDPPPAEPEPEEVDPDTDVCDVCGRKGRAPGHH